MFKIGDYVTRKSYDNDIIFKIYKIEDNKYYLKGADIRLYADSFLDDLVLYLGDIKNFDDFELSDEIDEKLNRDEYFYLPGKILHIDADHLCNSELEKVL